MLTRTVCTSDAWSTLTFTVGSLRVRVRVRVKGGEYVHIHTYVPTTTRATVCYIREM